MAIQQSGTGGSATRPLTKKEKFAAVQLFVREIAGFSVEGFTTYDQLVRRQVSSLLPRDVQAGRVWDEVWVGAWNASNTLVGAAKAQPPYENMQELRRDVARDYGAQYRLLTALAVDPSQRGQGIGQAVLSEVERICKLQGARYLFGYVSDADGSVGFYRSQGYIVEPHGAPLRALPPLNIPMMNDLPLVGHWFHKPL